MASRILYASLFHETNTFVEQPTTWGDFKVTRETEIFSKLGDGSVTDGFLAEAQCQGWTVIPTIDAWAVPGGIVDDAALDQFWREFQSRARPVLSDGIDGIFIVLHGAMVTRRFPDVEGELLERVRALPGAAQLPLFGVLDLHANVTAQMCRHADGLVHYRENPHTDAKRAGARGAQLLARSLRESRRPHMSWCRPSMMWAPPATGTATEPMRSLGHFARQVERENPGIWECNVAAGFSFSDTPDAGVSISVISTQDRADDLALLEKGASLAWSLRQSGLVSYPSPKEVLEQCRQAAASVGSSGPVLLVEPADNIGAGAPGDGTGILRAFFEAGTNDALLAIHDPAAVESLSTIAAGDTRELTIGGRGSCLDEGPVTLPVTLVSRSDGKFKLEDEQSHLAAMSGLHFDMGPCAVVRSEGITLLLTSRRTPPMDLGQWRSQGVEPRNFAFIGIKAAVAHRRAYDPIARASYFVATPGPCTSDLARLTWKHVRRPVWPLDLDAVFNCQTA